MTAPSEAPVFGSLVLVGADPAFAAVVRRLLAGSTRDELIVCGLSAAVAALRTAQPDLVLLDADSVDSPAVAVSLLALCSASPILAATAGRQLSPADVVALRVAGATAVLPKVGDSSGFGLLRHRPAVVRGLLAMVERQTLRRGDPA